MQYSNNSTRPPNRVRSRENSNDPTLRGIGSQRINESRGDYPPNEIFAGNEGSEPRNVKMKQEYTRSLRDRYDYDA